MLDLNDGCARRRYDDRYKQKLLFYFIKDLVLSS